MTFVLEVEIHGVGTYINLKNEVILNICSFCTNRTANFSKISKMSKSMAHRGLQPSCLARR
jgi:hypothetical protein